MGPSWWCLTFLSHLRFVCNNRIFFLSFHNPINHGTSDERDIKTSQSDAEGYKKKERGTSMPVARRCRARTPLPPLPLPTVQTTAAE